jgi:hypothetical protein
MEQSCGAREGARRACWPQGRNMVVSNRGKKAMKKLTPDQLVKKWISALRSGKYKQAHGALKGRDGYCCLGVLCVVAGIEIGPDEGYLSVPVQQLAGLASEVGCIKGSQSLANLNDAGKSFAEIADIIESHPPGLFTWKRPKKAVKK